MATERTLILLKPDCVARRRVGDVLSRFEAKGLKLVAMKLRVFPASVLEEHYSEHREKPFFGDVVRFMTSGPVLALVLEGNRAIETCRKLIGKTRGYEAEPGTIRGDLGLSGQFNLIHGSDSPGSSEREIALWFTGEELCEYALDDERWLVD